MSIVRSYMRLVNWLLPSPFAIALILTLLTAFAVLLFGDFGEYDRTRLEFIAESWFQGMWNKGLLAFLVQMMLILVLGHILAVSGPAKKVIEASLVFCKDSASAAMIVCSLTLVVAFINWGLGLIFGALLARKVGEYCYKRNIEINYPLIGAAGYSGLMVWHGGLSGSAPLTIAAAGHSTEALIGVIPVSMTIFSSMNITASILLLIGLPLLMFGIGKRIHEESNTYSAVLVGTDSTEDEVNEGDEQNAADRIDRSIIPGILIGLTVLLVAFYQAFLKPGVSGLSFLNLNFVNLSLLGIGLLLHKNLASFTQAAGEAISGATGILLQFPLYFGIMGLMKDSGLASSMSEFFVSISTESTLPLFTFVSAGIVNIFVPSGGGQWQVQGPIILEAATALSVPHSKVVMALAYGDQLTNMLQPFWALPLLGITGLKAQKILPYTLMIMLFGVALFIFILILF